MENAVDALIIGFSIFALVTVLGISFVYIGQAKSTADYVLYYNDKTNFYENLSSKEKNRVVSVKDVISTLYRFDKETISITVNLGENNSRTFDLSNETTKNTTNETEIGNYIKDNLNNLPKESTKFVEEFVEVPYSGKYQYGDDGSEVTIGAGDKMLYVTYTLQS